MISKGTKLFMNLHFPHSNMPAYRKIPVNLVVYPDFRNYVISIVLIECKIILLFMLSYRKLTSGIAIFPMFTVQTICVKLFSELQ